MNLPVAVCLCRKVQVPGSGVGASAWPYRGRVNGGGSSNSLNGSLSSLTLMKSTSLRTPGKGFGFPRSPSRSSGTCTVHQRQKAKGAIKRAPATTSAVYLARVRGPGALSEFWDLYFSTKAKTYG
jgi:hypothetical protein